jgi:hypothetical protein
MQVTFAASCIRLAIAIASPKAYVARSRMEERLLVRLVSEVKESVQITASDKVASVDRYPH